jgi:hypothetical protein
MELTFLVNSKSLDECRTVRKVLWFALSVLCLVLHICSILSFAVLLDLQSIDPSASNFALSRELPRSGYPAF